MSWVASSSAVRPSCSIRVTVRRNSTCRVSSRFLNESNFFLSMDNNFAARRPLFPSRICPYQSTQIICAQNEMRQLGSATQRSSRLLGSFLAISAPAIGAPAYAVNGYVRIGVGLQERGKVGAESLLLPFTSLQCCQEVQECLLIRRGESLVSVDHNNGFTCYTVTVS